ncbi:MAG: hypothetical protein LBI95_02025 [Holosporales bacterium]|jgi:hypothetical protein|nr:hypothetical protein [Holosporales bacterium]
MIVSGRMMFVVFVCVISTVCGAMDNNGKAVILNPSVNVDKHILQPLPAEAVRGSISSCISLSPRLQQNRLKTLVNAVVDKKEGYSGFIIVIVQAVNNYIANSIPLKGDEDYSPWIVRSCLPLTHSKYTTPFFGRIESAIDKRIKMVPEEERKKVEFELFASHLFDN